MLVAIEMFNALNALSEVCVHPHLAASVLISSFTAIVAHRLSKLKGHTMVAQTFRGQAQLPACRLSEQDVTMYLNIHSLACMQKLKELACASNQQYNNTRILPFLLDQQACVCMVCRTILFCRCRHGAIHGC